MPSLHPIDLTELLKPHAGKWVALNEEQTEVVGSGLTLDEALAEARKRGEEHPIVIKAPDQFSAFLL